MYYSQSAINSLMDEHKAIRGQMNMLIEIMEHWKTRLASWDISQMDDVARQTVSNNLDGLRMAVRDLDDGLKNHHNHEDEVMPPLVGDLIMKAVRMEHDEMLRRFGVINSVLLDEKIETFIQNGLETLQHIEDLAAYARTHSLREDGILHFLKQLPDLRE